MTPQLWVGDCLLGLESPPAPNYSMVAEALGPLYHQLEEDELDQVRTRLASSRASAALRRSVAGNVDIKTPTAG